MKDEDKTKEQFMDELAKLRQENIELKIALKYQEPISNQTIRERDERLSLVWEISNDGFWDWDIATDYIYYSPRLAEILGYSSEELKLHYHTLEKLIHPDDMPAAVKALSEHWDGQRAKYEAEYRMLNKSGEWKWMMARGQVVASNKAGQPLRMIGVNIDITERKQAEDALRESNERLMTVMNKVEACIYIADMQTYELLFVNEYGLKECGDDIIGKPCWKVLQGLDGPCTFCTNDKLLTADGRSAGVYQWEFQNKVNDRWYYIRDCAIQWTDGQLVRMEIATDINERKQAEQAEKDVRRQMEQIIEHLPDATFVINERGEVVFWNKAIEEITGILKEQMIGRDNFEYAIPFYGERRAILIDLPLLHESEYDKLKNNYDFIRQEGNTLLGEVYVPKSYSGKGAYLLGSASKLLDLQGNTVGAIQSIRDITERKRMEEQLRLSEECFSKAFNASPVAMAISTLEEGRTVKVNDAFCSIVGYSPDDVIGRKSIEFGFWADPADRDLIKQKLRANQSVKNMEIGFCKYTGEQGLGLYSGEPFDNHGERCMLSTMVDITELRQIEVEMTRLSRLNLVGEIAASIGHEIRNPMTSVRGFLQMFKTRYIEDKEFLDLMIEELDRANYIITEFLSLAKTKMVDMKLRNFNAIINEILPLIQAQAQSRDQHIKLELDELPDLLLDKDEIRQLLLNLVNNGLESMASTGDVIIRTFIEKETVVLGVRDQGYGIDRELLDKLGTPFFSTKEQGTGLGLAVCYRIASRHNAKIDIDTSPTGTTFYVRFPCPAATMVS